MRRPLAFASLRCWAAGCAAELRRCRGGRSTGRLASWPAFLVALLSLLLMPRGWPPAWSVLAGCWNPSPALSLSPPSLAPPTRAAGGWLARAFLGQAEYKDQPLGASADTLGSADDEPHPAVRTLVTLGTPHTPPPADKASMPAGRMQWRLRAAGFSTPLPILLSPGTRNSRPLAPAAAHPGAAPGLCKAPGALPCWRKLPWHMLARIFCCPASWAPPSASPRPLLLFPCLPGRSKT